jgi:hypothetical protein
MCHFHTIAKNANESNRPSAHAPRDVLDEAMVPYRVEYYW